MIQGYIDNSPVRSVKGKVELYNGSALLNTFTYRDKLKSFTVERVGEESKFFGFGIFQKINIKLIDKDRELEITTDNSFKAFLTTGNDYVKAFPTFYVTEVHRDENTNELSITAYDALYWASGADLGVAYSMAAMLDEFLLSATANLNIIDTSYDEDLFAMEFPEGVNIEGTEKSKELLDDIAEVTQTIYYINNEDALVFKGLDKDGLAALTINKADYIKLDSKTNRRLAAICKATELGDNVEASLSVSGTTQYIRDNVFLEGKEDIEAFLNNALAAIGGITINQFECSWRGNYLLEPGDKIDLITKDDATITAYVLNDSVQYNGFLTEKTSWKYEESEAETASNPTTIGESLRQTYARVDKANKSIEMLASDVKANGENITSLELTAQDITGKVATVEEVANDAIENINGTLDTLTKTVEAKITDEEVSIKISEALANGVDKVETSTGFTFDDEGLTVSKTDSEISTTITEDGMRITKENETVLTANNIGVDARNLHATTYLIIGNNSRFEDTQDGYTACFWIGG